MIDSLNIATARTERAQSLAEPFWHAFAANTVLALLTAFWYVQCWHLWSTALWLVVGGFEAGSGELVYLGLAAFGFVTILPLGFFGAAVSMMWPIGWLYHAGGYVSKQHADKFVMLTALLTLIVILGGALAWIIPWSIVSYAFVLLVWAWYLARLRDLV